MPRSPTLGLLIVAAAAILLGGVVWLQRPGSPVYYAELREAPGVREGSLVKFRGIAVGSVRHVAFTDTSVRLTLQLTRDDTPMPAGTGFRVRMQGIFGDNAVELTPSRTPRAARLPEGAVLPLSPPDSAELAQRALAETVGAKLRESVNASRRAADSAATADSPLRRAAGARP